MLKPRPDLVPNSPQAPAAFRRLCVETIHIRKSPVNTPPAAFRRLCVETAEGIADIGTQIASRLQAAVC